MAQIFCQKMQQEGEALEHPPYPGEMGKKIQATFCKAAWREWLVQQTMLINENRLNVLDPKSKAFLEAEMHKYFFGEGSEKPIGFKPEE